LPCSSRSSQISAPEKQNAPRPPTRRISYSITFHVSPSAYRRRCSCPTFVTRLARAKFGTGLPSFRKRLAPTRQLLP
jgi:hypothetical protein